MDFFKSAVASIAKGPAFPYTFGERMDIDNSIWTLHHGTKREDGSKCSIFSFDINANRNRLSLARNALRKFKTIRHPGVVKMLDSVETDQLIYIATERVTPLNWSTRRNALSEESLKRGLHSVAKTLKFINDEASSVHGNIRASSIFTCESGEWKVGGLDILSSIKEDDAILFSHASLVPDIGRYSPPEIAKQGWSGIKNNPVHAIDSYEYGILVSEVFSGGFSGTDQIGSLKGIPQGMQASYKRLTHAVPKMRLSVGHFYEQGRRKGGFFDTPLIDLTDGIENLGLKSAEEREVFLNELQTVVESDDFPEDFLKVKILPELLKSVEFGGGGAKPFSLVMRIADKLSEEEYDSQITPVVVRLFSSPDRAMRVCLLDNLPLMIDHLSQKLVTDKIFPQMVTGFGDLAPIVREQTVKAVLVVTPKLSDRVINGDLLRHLAKTANDEQPGIRTNTTICLGKIAKNLGAASRAKVLTAAFTRSLRDPFVHARNASLLALAATADMFTEEDCATKMLPAICPSLIDKEKMIRDQANKTLNVYLDRVRKYSATLPDSVLPPPGEAAATGGARMASPQPGNSWTGWAVSSFTNKVGAANGEMQQQNNTPNGNGARPTASLERSSSTPGNKHELPHRPSPHAVPSAPAVPKAPSTLRASTTPDVDDDFDTNWDDNDDTTDNWNADADDDDDDGAAEAWGEVLEESEPKPKHTTQTKPAISYDDGGEPDFEGWLNAQAAAKKKVKPLPKGLGKKTVAAAPVAKPSVGTGSVAAAKGRVGNGKPAPLAEKKKKQEVLEAEEDDGWGDAWG
ncbi:hypothetical protein MBLNU230_g1605t1 [Neophaeotheca triangularis]